MKHYGLFFIAQNKSIFYKAYYSLEELHTAINEDKEFKELQKEYKIDKIQIVELNRDEEDE